MKVGVVMTTANRVHANQGLGSSPGVNYVDATVKALAAQGVSPELFATHPNVKWLRPTLEALPAMAAHLHVPTRPLNRIENGAAAMLGVPPCDWVLHLEDDVKPCADLVGSVTRWLEMYERDDRRIVLFWSRDNYVRSDITAACADHPAGQLFGAVAVALRRTDALDFGAWVVAHAPRWRSGTARLRGFDKMMRQWHRDRHPQCQHLSASVPSFVQHMGKESSLKHLWPRATDHWTSPTFTGAAYG